MSDMLLQTIGYAVSPRRRHDFAWPLAIEHGGVRG